MPLLQPRLSLDWRARKRVAHLDPVSGDCGYLNVECKYGCGEKLEKNEIAERLEMFCPKRPVTCSHCSEEGEHEFITGKHKGECHQLPINCPNDCGAQVKQGELQNHLQDCPLELVECEFSHAGCTTQLQRKDMSQHLQEDAQNHLSLQTKIFVPELQKKENQLARIVMVHDEKFKHLSDIHSQQLGEKDKIIGNLTKELEKKFQEEVKNLGEKLDAKLEKVTNTLRSKCDELKTNSDLVPIDQLPEISEASNLNFFSLLHRGKHMTEIWRGTYNTMEVAIKRHMPGVSPASILGEAHILRNVKHKNIVTLYSTVICAELVCMIMEYMSSTNLHEYLAANSPLLLYQQTNICTQVASALQYLQQKLCIHRKIRAGNVLIDVTSQRCKLKDFGLAIIVTSSEHYFPCQEGVQFPIKWSAPEIIKEERFHLKSDVWSFGMLVWEVVTGEEPYKDLSISQASDRITAGTLMPKPSSCPDTFFTVMRFCWRQDPRDRPIIDTMLSLLGRVPDSHRYSTVQ